MWIMWIHYIFNIFVFNDIFYFLMENLSYSRLSYNDDDNDGDDDDDDDDDFKWNVIIINYIKVMDESMNISWKYMEKIE